MEIPHRGTRPVASPDIYVDDPDSSNGLRTPSSSTSAPSDSSIPMSVPHSRDPVPPPLPPPRHLADMADDGGNGPDIMWQWGNLHEDDGDRGRSMPSQLKSLNGSAGYSIGNNWSGKQLQTHVPRTWPEAELPLHKRHGPQDDEIRGQLMVPTASNTRRWIGFDNEGHKEDGENEGYDSYKNTGVDYSNDNEENLPTLAENAAFLNTSQVPTTPTQPTHSPASFGSSSNRYRCHCGYTPSGEERWKASNLRRHKRTQHPTELKVYTCGYPGCKSKFTRMDGLRSHRKDKGHFGFHGIPDLEIEDTDVEGGIPGPLPREIYVESGVRSAALAKEGEPYEHGNSTSPIGSFENSQPPQLAKGPAQKGKGPAQKGKPAYVEDVDEKTGRVVGENRQVASTKRQKVPRNSREAGKSRKSLSQYQIPLRHSSLAQNKPAERGKEPGARIPQVKKPTVKKEPPVRDPTPEEEEDLDDGLTIEYRDNPRSRSYRYSNTPILERQSSEHESDDEREDDTEEEHELLVKKRDQDVDHLPPDEIDVTDEQRPPHPEAFFGLARKNIETVLHNNAEGGEETHCASAAEDQKRAVRPEYDHSIVEDSDEHVARINDNPSPATLQRHNDMIIRKLGELEKVSKSCTECRRRKQKCNGQRPCNHCGRRYPPVLCTSARDNAKNASDKSIEPALVDLDVALGPFQAPSISGSDSPENGTMKTPIDSDIGPELFTERTKHDRTLEDSVSEVKPPDFGLRRPSGIRPVHDHFEEVQDQDEEDEDEKISSDRQSSDSAADREDESVTGVSIDGCISDNDTKLEVFEQELPQLTIDRYSYLQERYIGRILKLMKESGARPEISMKLIALGESESTARPSMCIFIQPDKKLVRKVRRFFNQPSIKSDFEPSKPNVHTPSLKVFVYEMPSGDLPWPSPLSLSPHLEAVSAGGIWEHDLGPSIEALSPETADEVNLFHQPHSREPQVSRSSSVDSLKSLVDSIFSIASLSSTSTVADMNNAFQRVLVVFRSDMILKGLYDELISRSSADKFKRNFAILLKRFAVDLENEAQCWNEQQTAKFIRSRARKIAQRITDIMYPSGLKIEEGRPCTFPAQIKADHSEDSGTDDEPDEFLDLERFVTNSNAFQKLRDNIRSFVGLELSNLTAELPFAQQDHFEVSQEDIFFEHDSLSCPQSQWFLSNFAQNIRGRLLPEPPIPNGLSRVRWKCPCGKILYDDYQELKPGAAKRMEDYLRRCSYKKCAEDTKSITQRISNLRGSLKSFFTSFVRRIQTMKSGERPALVNTELRYYSDARTTRTPAHTSGEVFYLLLCHNDGIGAEIVKLRQPDICDINNDQRLFSFLHEEYLALRKRWWTLISLWTLQSIKFVRFELYENELVDVKKLDEVPPPTKDNEYRHGPPNPPELNPPLGSTLLMHLFKHPELAGTRKHCLKKIPRKLRNRLAVLNEEDDAIGWGLQFIEGWSKKRLMYMTALTFGLCSFVVMILVSILGQNIQNAAAIASFMLSFVTIGIATAQAALHMS